MPLYNTATAAAATGATQKWMDNLLSHNKIDGATGGRQGVARRLSLQAVRTAALTQQLNQSLGIPVPSAVRIATDLLSSPNASCAVSPLLTITFDRSALEQQLLTRLQHAVEVTPIRKRGRP